MQRFGDFGNPHCVARCTEPELRMLRFLLARNAGCMHVHGCGAGLAAGFSRLSACR